MGDVKPLGAEAQMRRLPRGPHQLAREEVLASQRARMLEAMAHAVAAKGYAATTVADVVGGAGVSRKTFYEHFQDKEDCFLAAFDAGVQVLVDTVERATLEAQVLNEQLNHALNSRVIIEQAKGMVAEHEGLDMPQAFDTLRHYARDHNLRLVDVATDVIGGTLVVSALGRRPTTHPS